MTNTNRPYRCGHCDRRFSSLKPFLKHIVKSAPEWRTKPSKQENSLTVADLGKISRV